MFMPRILVVISPPIAENSALQTIACARETAFRPAVLRFALPASLGDEFIRQNESFVYYLGNEALEASLALLTDETHFLLISGAHCFEKNWDLSLLNTLRSLRDKPTLLTASITPCKPSAPRLSDDAPTQRAPAVNPGGLQTLRHALPEIRRRRERSASELPSAVENRQPEVCLPALKETMEDGSVVIGSGLPLVCSSGPVNTLVIDPAFVFGPVRFLEENTLTLSTLSLAAYLTGWRCCVPPTPPAWPVSEPPRRFLSRPEVMPGTTISRFEQLLGFHYGQESGSAKAMLGLFTPENTYPQRMSPALLLNQKASAARLHMLESHMPLIVSAFIDFPAPRYPLPFYLLRFGFLKAIRSLPLLLFTGGSQERSLRASFPHTQSYPDNALLPRELLEQGMTPQQHFGRSKPLLMLRAAKKQPEFTHAAWLDMDILPHPVCPEAMPDFDSITDDRIHLATVGGVPDASFILIPCRYLKALSREVQSITLLDAELKRGFSEELLWERLFVKKPEWFCIHPMPRRKLFFLSLLDLRLLSQTIRPLLEKLPQPSLGTAEDAQKTHGRTTQTLKE